MGLAEKVGGQNRRDISCDTFLDCFVIRFVLIDKGAQLEEWQQNSALFLLWSLDDSCRSNFSKTEKEEGVIFSFLQCPSSGPLSPVDIFLNCFPSFSCCFSGLLWHPRRASFNQMMVLHPNAGPLFMFLRTCVFSGSVSYIYVLWFKES